MKTIIFDSVPSTNDELKKLKNPEEDVVMIARMQTGGRGSKGRSFSCEKGGVVFKATQRKGLIDDPRSSFIS